LTVTYLGKGLKNFSKTDKKHDIKRADRLCASTHLHSERIEFYRYMTKIIIVTDIEHTIIDNFDLAVA
jgi:hypothetical protein